MVIPNSLSEPSQEEEKERKGERRGKRGGFRDICCCGRIIPIPIGEKRELLELPAFLSLFPFHRLLRPAILSLFPSFLLLSHANDHCCPLTPPFWSVSLSDQRSSIGSPHTDISLPFPFQTQSVSSLPFFSLMLMSYFVWKREKGKNFFSHTEVFLARFVS